MSTHRSSRVLLGLVGAATVAALVVPGTAFAAKGSPGIPGGGGGGEETTANSLSVPAIFVGTNPFTGLTCDGVFSLPPAGVPLAGYELDPAAFYFVQGVHKWQATCVQGVATASATAQWGDNLAGDAKLKVGSPIRVELGLYDDTGMAALTGWEVLKLEPSLLDRVSAYGTPATADESGTYSSTEFVSPGDANLDLGTRVWAPGTLKIYAVGSDGLPTGAPPVYEGQATAEINAKGKVVFGYNLRVTALGTYRIDYTFPGVTITGIDAGFISGDSHTAWLTITVISGGGGGGGKRS